MVKRLIVVLALVVAGSVLVGCGSATPEPSANATPTSAMGGTDGDEATERPTATAEELETTPVSTGTPADPEQTADPSPGASPSPMTAQGPFEPVVGLELVAEGLTAPVSLKAAGDGSGRLFLVDQAGLIRVITAEGELREEPFLDIRGRMVAINPGYDERGLLGLAFDPDYEDSGQFAVYYSAPLNDEAPSGWNHTGQVSWFSVSEQDENVADLDSERSILRVDQPQGNHNGGEIAFGPDGYLYVALGDGGGANDVGTGHVEDWYEANAGGNGQDITQNLLGSILRIDVDTSELYRVPEDNPFAGEGEEGLPEIWAYGLRNPYRFSFDAGGDGELFAADVGQNLWEEVSIITRGGNYGWNVKEGTHCFSAATPNQPPEDCPSLEPDGIPLIDPVLEYQNGNAPGGLGLAVVGGYVYRGQALPSFDGRYVFGDWSTSFGQGDGILLAATRPDQEGAMWSLEELDIAGREEGKLGAFLLGFGQGPANELYVLTSQSPGPQGNTGRVWKMVPAE